MLILDQFKQAALTEKIATLTSTVILIGMMCAEKTGGFNLVN